MECILVWEYIPFSVLYSLFLALREAMLMSRLTAGPLRRGQTHAPVLSFHKHLNPTRVAAERAAMECISAGFDSNTV